MTSNRNDLLHYIIQRPERKICLARCLLTISTVHPEHECWKKIDEEIRSEAKMREGAMLLKHLTVTKVDQGLRITFWCHSGTKQFLDRLTGVDIKKNCVELTVYAFSKLVLDVVHRQIGKVTTINHSYMMDISPCPDCEERLTDLRNNLKAPSVNTNIVFSEPGFVLDYQQFSTLSEETKKTLKDKTAWINVRNSELAKSEWERGNNIGLHTFLECNQQASS